MKNLAKIASIIVSIAYPFVVFACLVIFKVSPRAIGLCLLVVAIVNFIALSDGVSGAAKARRWGALALSVILVLIIMLTNSVMVSKLYPVIVNVVLLTLFGFTLFKPPTMIFRFASTQDKSLRESGPDRDKAEGYCRKVTIVWCCFFAANGLAALFTALFASAAVWALYNGFLSYILIGVLFVGEILVRRRAMKR